MRFEIPADFLSQILTDDALTPVEVRAILRIAHLAAEIDFHEDPDELATLEEVEQLLQLASPEPFEPVSPLPLDAEERRAWIQKLVPDLESPWARELAYAIAYLLSTADLALAPVESMLIDELQHALGISDERAAELVAISAEAVTPGIEELDPASDLVLS